MGSIAEKSRYTVVGLMSGTSLDGLDIACCQFRAGSKGWKYALVKGTTVRYPVTWHTRIAQAHTLPAEAFAALDADYGTWLGQQVRKFLSRHALKADFVASHGHTVFHQPARRFTTQAGSGYHLYAASGLPVVNDFRSLDVALGGEGAPLVPAGDKLLFSDYEACLNMGGIANVSLDDRGARIAFDICFCNMALNLLAAEGGRSYDKNGDMAAEGEINPALMKALSKVYARWKRRRPSLGRELFEQEILPLITDKRISLPDRLRTVTESIAIEICDAVRRHLPEGRVMCAGGGAFNSFLLARMLEHGADQITFMLPEPEIINFKEAMVFAFLGVLRVRGEINCLKSVTRAARDSSSGTMIGFP